MCISKKDSWLGTLISLSVIYLIKGLYCCNSLTGTQTNLYKGELSDHERELELSKKKKKNERALDSLKKILKSLICHGIKATTISKFFSSLMEIKGLFFMAFSVVTFFFF